MYDYFLGGSHNFKVDRDIADQALQHHPGIRVIARENRAVMRRTIRFALAQGITQFLDIGSGIPTFGNVHEIAQAEHPRARVAYVDNDLIAVAHSRAVLDGNPDADIARADLRDPNSILDSPEVKRLLDLDQPVALMLVAIVHFFADEDHPADLIAHLRDALAPGSVMVMTHATLHGPTPSGQLIAADLYAKTGSRLVMRDEDEVAPFFEGWELIPPGIVPLPFWRPDGAAADDVDDEYATHGLAAVGIKR
jgi:SAM-dependent methyltransferase